MSIASTVASRVTDSKTRPLLGLMGMALVLVVLWSWLSGIVNAPNDLATSDGVWQAELVYSGATTDYRVPFSFIAPTEDALETEGLQSTDCKPVGERGQIACTGFATLAADSLLLEIQAPSLEVGELAVVRQTRNAPFDGVWLSRLFLLALAFAPLAWVFHRRQAVADWALIAFSATFLFLLQPGFTAALFAILGVSFFVGRRYRASDNRTGRFVLSWITVTTTFLLILKNFKAVFFLPFEQYQSLALVLPLGTSYFLIRLLDLELRWHRGQLEDLNLRKYLVYLFFPGTLVAGPIEMVDSFFANRLEKITVSDVVDGSMRICIGVAKKLFLVDLFLAQVLFGSGLWSSVVTSSASSADVVKFCFFAYLLAYLDFSAYSDIAIGISRLFGYEISENFTWPILATDIAEFWRRWHISLSSWAFRNIFFTTLMATRARWVSLMATLIAIGLWHDLGLSWLTWGVYHGVGLAVAAALPNRGLIPDNFLGKGFKIAVTNLYIAAGFAFVTIPDYSLAWSTFIKFVIAPVAVFL